MFHRRNTATGPPADGPYPQRRALARLASRRVVRPVGPDVAQVRGHCAHTFGMHLGTSFVNPCEVQLMHGSFASLMFSGLPFEGTIGAVRLAFSQDGTWIPYPTY